MPEAESTPSRFRVLDEDHFEYEFYDRVCDVTHILYYRLPTEEERAKYRSGTYMIKKKGKDRKVFTADDVTPLNRQYGKQLCTGFKKGTFGVGKGDEARLISHDPEDADFHKDWKPLIDKVLPNAFAGLGGRGMNPEGKKKEDETDLEEVSLDEIAKLQGFDSLDAFLNSGGATETPHDVQEGEPEAPLVSSSGA